MMFRVTLLLPALFLAAALQAQGPAAVTPPLPPPLPWTGASESLIVDQDDPWITPAERDDFRFTPSYAETRAWLERLVAESELLTLESFGSTAEGRDLYYVRAGSNHDGHSRPVVLIQAGIHAHEIDGKDAGLMLLRDIALRGKETLLDEVTLVFVPIYNADGHERVSPYNAPHLRGPENPGTRDTAQHINLNRDYAKADAPETRAMLRLLRRLDPVLYVDMHVSDGFDHAYDVTYTYAGWGRFVQSEAITRWLNGPFESGVNAFLRAQGHNPHFYPSAIDDHDIQKGLRVAAEGPRYSTGYGDFARIPTVLVEMHNLKPYRRRVLGAYSMMEGALRAVSYRLTDLQAAITADRAARPQTLAVRWERDATPIETIPFTGVAHERYQSPVSGDEEIRYLGHTVPMRLPVIGQRPVETVSLPAAWWVPAAERDVIALLDLHGIDYERIRTSREMTLDSARLSNVEIERVYDSRPRVSGDVAYETRAVVLPAGSVRVSYDQARGLLAAALLEPQAVDSVFSWGFFPYMLEGEGSMERFIAAPLARRILEDNPALQAAFEAKLAADEAFAADPGARLAWVLDHSPFADRDRFLYPIHREITPDQAEGKTVPDERFSAARHRGAPMRR